MDAHYSYRFTVDRIVDADTRLTIGINNVFDRMAQRLPQAGGLETGVDDPFGLQPKTRLKAQTVRLRFRVSGAKQSVV